MPRKRLPAEKRPKIFATNAMLVDTEFLEYPILTEIPTEGSWAIVAIVKATRHKIDFWIDVKHAHPILPTELLTSRKWIADFKRGSKSGGGRDLLEGHRGWTTMILRVALEVYEQRYLNAPRCMVGVFDQFNREKFWRCFEELYPGKKMSDFVPQERAAVARECIEATPFWRARKKLGYTKLMFEAPRFD